MKLLENPTKISKKTPLKFEVDKADCYLISLSARVKSEKQRGKDFTDDEDLRAEIDNRKFPKLDNPQRYFDSPAAFSGGNLHDRLKTVHFIVHLETGKHTISLIPDGEALIEKLEIEKLANFPQLHLDFELQAEKADGRPWLTFALIDLGLKTFSVKVTTNWKFPDGDDLKIIVDNKVKKNNLSILHRNWVFASSILRKLFHKETSEKTFEENLPKQSLHYIEFWADETPTLHFVDFEFEEVSEESTDVQKYKDGRYNEYDDDILKAANFWNEFFLNQKYPPPAPLDPNLVKAIIYMESRMGQGSSFTGHPAYPDVMQVGNPEDDAIHVLNNDGKRPTEYEACSGKIVPVDYEGRIKVETSYESIYWGVRWLYHKAQDIGVGEEQIWYPWKKAVHRYGPGKETYTESIWNLYEHGKNPNGKENLF